MNAILGAINLIAVGLALAAWLSPDALEHYGRYGLARAAALRKARAAYKRSFDASMRSANAKHAKTRREVVVVPAQATGPRWFDRIGGVASRIGAALGCVVIIAGIVALAVMPQ